MNFPDSPSGGDLFNGFIYNATLGVWDVATSDGYFAVTNSGSGAYLFNGFGTDGDSNPTLYLHRGKTYEFAVNASGHPFYINSTSGTGTGNAYSDGVTNNGAATGTIKFVVPQDAPSKLYYNCQYHSSMAGEIIIPRAAQIDDLSDVDTSTTAPTDGQVLAWDNTASKWEPATASSGIALTDLSVTTNAAGTAALSYNNSTGAFSYTPPDLSSYLTSYTVTQSDVTTHQAALSITESQISDFGSYLSNLSEDTSPQLGANLDLNGYDIVTTSNGPIDLDPNGSGVVVFKGNSTRGAGQFKLNCEANSHGITIKGPPHSAGASYTLTLPNDDGSANQVLKTDGSGNLSWVAQTTAYGDADVDTHLNTSSASSNQVLSWTGSDYSWVTQSGGGGGLSDVVSDTTPQLGGNLDVNGNSIVSVSNGNIPITPDGTGKIVLDGLSWPTSDGSANQVLQTDGSGQLSFVAQSGGGGGASVTTSDTAPSSPSGGDLWFDTTTLRLYVYYNDGSSSQWVKANPSGSRDSNTSVAIQETAPSNPSSGDMWFDPNALKTYIYYNDGDSNQWVQANPTGGGGSGSGGASNSNIIALNMFFGG